MAALLLIAHGWSAKETAMKTREIPYLSQGLDYYKVGPTLGAGASAPFVNDSLWYSKNFTSFDVLDNGPLRITVRFNFEPYKADAVEVNSSRVISLDAGNFFKANVGALKKSAADLKKNIDNLQQDIENILKYHRRQLFFLIFLFL